MDPSVTSGDEDLEELSCMLKRALPLPRLKIVRVALQRAQSPLVWTTPIKENDLNSDKKVDN